MSSDTISAISTANGRGGVAVIRMSGDKALAVAEKMFSPSGKRRVREFSPYRMYPGNIHTQNFTDYGLCVYFKSPKSYTGEDVVEFHCHGGTEIAQGVLKQTFLCGARPALAGEFTKRAFLNGKMTLSAAEGVADMINANSQSMIKAGYQLLQNKLGGTVRSMQDEIKNILAGIEVDMDYPEEDLASSLPDLTNLKDRVLSLTNRLDKLVSSYSTAGHTVLSGISVAIVGLPNSGKSSLLNCLLGREKAIVSDVCGTTRDIVEGELHLNGILFRLYDTAGIRESTDAIEKIGVERAQKTLEQADIVLHVIDASQPLTAEDMALSKKIASGQRLLMLTVYNKSDLGTVLPITDKNTLVLSAKLAQVDELKQRLYESVADKYTFDSDFVVEERHYNALKRADELLKGVWQNCGSVPLDMLTIDLSESWQALGEITGETANEEIISEIFSKFCVGK